MVTQDIEIQSHSSWTVSSRIKHNRLMCREWSRLGLALSWGICVGSLIKSSEQPRGKWDHSISQMRKTKHRAAQTWQARQLYTGSKTGSQQQWALSHLEACSRTPFLVFRTGPWIFPESAPQAGPRPAVSASFFQEASFLWHVFPTHCAPAETIHVSAMCFSFASCHSIMFCTSLTWGRATWRGFLLKYHIRVPGDKVCAGNQKLSQHGNNHLSIRNHSQKEPPFKCPFLFNMCPSASGQCFSWEQDLQVPAKQNTATQISPSPARGAGHGTDGTVPTETAPPRRRPLRREAVGMVPTMCKPRGLNTEGTEGPRGTC